MCVLLYCSLPHWHWQTTPISGQALHIVGVNGRDVKSEQVLLMGLQCFRRSLCTQQIRGLFILLMCHFKYIRNRRAPAHFLALCLANPEKHNEQSVYRATHYSRSTFQWDGNVLKKSAFLFRPKYPINMSFKEIKIIY